MHIINSILADASGGRWQVVCDYCRILTRLGHSVTLLVDSRHRPDNAQLPDGIPVLTIRNRGHYDFFAARRLAPRLTQTGIAIAHCSRSVALLKSALRGRAPVLAVTHSTKVRRLLDADAVIALTDSLRDAIRAAGRGRSLPVFVVPNRIDVPTRLPSRRTLQSPPLLGALGRFDPVKGFDVFIDALHRLADQGVALRARLAGAGDEEQRLRAQIRGLGLDGRIELGGWIEPARVPAFLSQLDLLCVPARSDAFGLTPLQGAAAGVPLLLSTASGHRAMFAADSEALFFDIDDSGQLAGQMRRLLADSALRETLRLAAFQRVEQCYSEAAVTRGIQDAIDNTLILYNNS